MSRFGDLEHETQAQLSAQCWADRQLYLLDCIRSGLSQLIEPVGRASEEVLDIELSDWLSWIGGSSYFRQDCNVYLHNSLIVLHIAKYYLSTRPKQSETSPVPGAILWFDDYRWFPVRIQGTRQDCLFRVKLVEALVGYLLSLHNPYIWSPAVFMLSVVILRNKVHLNSI